MQLRTGRYLNELECFSWSLFQILFWFACLTSLVLTFSLPWFSAQAAVTPPTHCGSCWVVTAASTLLISHVALKELLLSLLFWIRFSYAEFSVSTSVEVMSLLVNIWDSYFFDCVCPWLAWRWQICGTQKLKAVLQSLTLEADNSPHPDDRRGLACAYKVRWPIISSH